MERLEAIGVDLGGTRLKAVRLAPDGAVAAEDVRPSRAAEQPLFSLNAIQEAVECLGARGRRAVVGLALPGAVDRAAGVLRGATPHLPHWTDFPVRDAAARALGLPVTVANDADAAAWAEHARGAARGCRHALTVVVGTGIGAGLVLDGRLHAGAAGAVGEIGHLPLDGRFPCRCGVPGCVEPEASGSGLLARAREAGLEVPDAEGVFALARDGEARAAALVARLVDRLGAAIAMAVQVADPEIVVVGGGLANQGDALLVPLGRSVRGHLPAATGARLRIVRSALGDTAGAIGAALLARDAAADQPS